MVIKDVDNKSKYRCKERNIYDYYQMYGNLVINKDVDEDFKVMIIIKVSLFGNYLTLGLDSELVLKQVFILYKVDYDFSITDFLVDWVFNNKDV